MKDVKPKNTKLEETEDDLNGKPICPSCGNLMVFESIDFDQEDSLTDEKKSDKGEWVCPHCQGEIDFLGGDDE